MPTRPFAPRLLAYLLPCVLLCLPPISRTPAGAGNDRPARAEPGPRRPARTAQARNTQTWVADVLARITLADRPAGEGGTVAVRLRIAADGTLADAGVEPGREALAARALAALRAAGPFPPPPRALLTLEGFTELSFPLELAPARPGADRAAPGPGRSRPNAEN